MECERESFSGVLSGVRVIYQMCFKDGTIYVYIHSHARMRQKSSGFENTAPV